MINLVPDNHDIARYAGESKIDPETGRLLGQAFRLRLQEDYLSVYCLNMLEGDDIPGRIEYLRKDIPLRTRSNGKLGVINVGEMKEYVKSGTKGEKNLTITNKPHIDSENPELSCNYHCCVRGFGYDDEIVADLIAECVKDEYPTLSKLKDSRMPR